MSAVERLLSVVADRSWMPKRANSASSAAFACRTNIRPGPGGRKQLIRLIRRRAMEGLADSGDDVAPR